MATIKGQVVPSIGDDTYVGHHAHFEYQKPFSGTTPGEDGAPLWQPATSTVAIAADGRFEFEVPGDKKLRGPFSFTVSAPNGALLHHEVIDRKTPPPTIKRTVDPAKPRRITPEDRKPGYRIRRLPGRVMDVVGKGVPGVPIIVWARDTDTAEDAFRVVLATCADGAGYFTADYPRGHFLEAYGLVGGGDAAPKIPVVLNKGAFPERLIFAMSTAAADVPNTDPDVDVPRGTSAEDQANSPETYADDIGGSRCVDFSKPDRSVEEFRFFHIVRTSDPEIRGTTINTNVVLDHPAWEKVLIDGFDDWKAGGNQILMRAGQPPEERAEEANSNAEHHAKAALSAEYDVGILRNLLSSGKPLSAKRLFEAKRASATVKFEQMVHAATTQGSGRDAISAENAIDWDHLPTIYQAATVAHGHLVNFKQTWFADGYSMGDLLYSLPLAPCQKKRIAVIDWRRRDEAERSEARQAEDSLEASLDRNRAIHETIGMAVNEVLNGASVAATYGQGSGGGAAGSYGMFSGAGGAAQGLGVSGSVAHQEGSRELAGQSMQSLRDAIMQAASSVRGQRATVVQTVSQDEQVRVETEVITNHNHCHALTMEYFEVLKHYRVEHNLEYVRECLFIPMTLSTFDIHKALRWRDVLSPMISDRRLRAGFDAAQRIDDNWEGSDFPTKRYADEEIDFIEGDLWIELAIVPPPEPSEDEDGPWKTFWKTVTAAYNAYATFWLTLLEGVTSHKKIVDIFNTEIAPKMAAEYVDQFEASIIKSTTGTESLSLDPTLVTRYKPGQLHRVRLSYMPDDIRSSRAVVSALRIKTGVELPDGSRAVVRRADIRYHTQHMDHRLFKGSVDNDLSGSDDVYLRTPLDDRERRNPREKDLELASRLLSHLNANVEFYHRAAWLGMDPARRYMLLDGFLSPDGQRSLASVVENRIVAVVGNTLVMPVVAGLNLDPEIKWSAADGTTLLDLYEGYEPPAAINVSLPQGGVYAEAVLGKCNSCEEIDDTRFWRWEESPCPDEPTEIQPVSTGSRRADPGDLTAADFSSPIINMQQAPAAPDPQGLSGAMQLLAGMGPFRDVTGLTQNQLNAIRALEKTQDTAVAMAQMAKDLQLQNMTNRNADRSLKRINDAEAEGQITPEKAQQFREGILKGTSGSQQEMGTSGVSGLVDKAGEHGAAVSYTTGNGETTDIDARPVEPSGSGRIVSETPVVTPTIDLSANDFDIRAFFPDDRDIPELKRSGALKNGGTLLDINLENFAGITSYNLCFDVEPEFTVLIGTHTSKGLPAKPLKPGIAKITVKAQKEPCSEVSKSPLATATMAVSVPQYVLVSEQFPTYVDDPGFDQTIINKMGTFTSFLSFVQLDHLRKQILEEAKATADHLLKPANVRVVWGILSKPETLPDQFVTTDFPSAGSLAAKTLVTHVALLDWFDDNTHPNDSTVNPRTLTGETRGVVSAEHALEDALKDSADMIRTYRNNERIYVWPRANLDVAGAALPSQGQRLTSQLVAAYQSESNPTTKADYEALAVNVFGRQIGSTIAHEVSHSIVGTNIAFFDNKGHLENSSGSDLLSPGPLNLFAHKTGIHVKNETLWPAINSSDDNRFSVSGLIRRHERMQSMSGITRGYLARHFPTKPDINAKRRE